MNSLLLIASILTLGLGIFLWFQKDKLFVAGPWIVNNSLFILVAILEPGFCVSMFYIGIGMYIILYYLNNYQLNKWCWMLIGFCIVEVLFSNSLQFIDWPFMNDNGNSTFIKTNILLLLFIPGCIVMSRLSTKSKMQVSNYFSKVNFEFYNWLSSLLYLTFFTSTICLLIIFSNMWLEEIPFSYGFILSVMIIANVYVFYVCYIQYIPQFKTCVIDNVQSTNGQSVRKEDREIQSLSRWDKKVNEHQLFLDSNLTLPKLAEQLEVHPKTFSSMINQHYKMSFHEYINRKRIQIAKERLIDPEFQSYTIIAIGLETGFSLSLIHI